LAKEKIICWNRYWGSRIATGRPYSKIQTTTVIGVSTVAIKGIKKVKSLILMSQSLPLAAGLEAAERMADC